MIYMINFFEFQETNVSFSLKTICKPKSRKLEKTIRLILIASDKSSLVHAVVIIAEHACDDVSKGILKLSAYQLQTFLLKDQYL